MKNRLNSNFEGMGTKPLEGSEKKNYGNCSESEVSEKSINLRSFASFNWPTVTSKSDQGLTSCIGGNPT
jgi:hypothetical protein